MKYSKIVVACGLAIAAMSAQAAGPTIPAGTKTLFISGASAPDNFLADMMSGSPTDMLPSAVLIRSNDSATAPSHRAYLGAAGSGIPGVTAGTNFLVIKRSKGGSVFGVDPVARASRIETLDLNNCVAAAAPYTWACGTKGIDEGVAGHNTAANTGLVPDVGVSDVEPGLFKATYNTENGQLNLNSAELGRLSNKPINQLMMGLVATDAVAATTHLSRAQYGAMLAGKYTDWSTIDGSADPVVVCRRVNGSGTQASYNWFFTGFPCTLAVNGHLNTPPAGVADSFGYDSAHAGTAADPIIVDPSAGFTVVENSTSGDVRNCLKAAQNGTDFTVTGSYGKVYKVTFSAVGGPSKAIGVLSLDSYNNAVAAGSGFSFRQLDGAGVFNGATQAVTAGPGTGISPSKANLVNGKYDFVVELSMQARNATVTNVNGDVVPALSADPVKNAFYNEFAKRAGSTKYTGNEGGTFTTVPNAFATLPTVDSYATKPALVSKFSHGGNTCSPLVGFPSL